MSSSAHHPAPQAAAASGKTENAPRDCGACNVCCTAMHVKPLDKSPGTPCEHQSESGCGIYADRPSVCRGWFCIWVRDPGRLFDDSHRPDRLGLFFTASDPEPATGRQFIFAHEVRPAAADEWAAQNVIRHLRQVAPVKVLPYRPPKPSYTTLTIGGADGERGDAGRTPPHDTESDAA